MDIVQFIVSAKKDTYASGKKPIKIEDGSERFTYLEDELEYQDTYRVFGDGFNGAFFGAEIISFKGREIWNMNYHGKIISSAIGIEKIYSFLRKAMRLLSSDRPFRAREVLKMEILNTRTKAMGISINLEELKRFSIMERKFIDWSIMGDCFNATAN